MLRLRRPCPRPRRLLGPLLLAVAFLAAPSAVHATLMVPLGLRALVDRSEQVVRGRVEQTESRWAEDRQAIYTEITLRVTRSYKGGARVGDLITVRREGGSVDGIGMRVYGAASFELAEDAVVFVERRGRGAYVTGMAQGKLRVVDEGRGQLFVVGDLRGLELQETIGAAPLEARRRPLGEFERQLGETIQASLRARASKPASKPASVQPPQPAGRSVP